MNILPKNKLHIINTRICISIFLMALLIVGTAASTIYRPHRSSAAASDSLSLTPNSGSYSVGSTFTLTLAENSNSDTINAVQANLTFNPAQLQFVGQTDTGPFGQALLPQISNGVVGLDYALVSNDAQSIATHLTETGPQTLATVKFEALATGPATINFGPGTAMIVPPGGQNVWNGATTGGSYMLTPEIPTGITESITEPGNGVIIGGSGAGINVSVEASDNPGINIASVKLYIDDDSYPVASDNSAPYNFVWNPSTVPNGTHTITATATDVDGNSISKTVTIKLEDTITSSPVVSITSPANGASVSGTIPIDSTVTDTVGITAVELLVDGNVVATDTSAPYNFSWNSTLLPNGTHNILVEAMDANNDASLAQESIITANGDTTPPSIPTGVMISAPLYNQVNLSWSPSSDNVGVTGYYVMRLDPDSSNYTNITPTGVTSTNYVDSSVNANNSYSYEIVAYDAAGNNSMPSTPVSVTTPSNPTITPPNAPTGLSASANGSDSEITLTWTAPTGSIPALSYNVYRGSSPTTIGTTPINGSSPVTTTTYGDTGLNPNTAYYYYVEAVSSSGISSIASNIANDTTAPPPPTNTTVEGIVTTVVKKVNQPLDNVLVHTNKGGSGGETIANTNGLGKYILPNIVSNQSHSYSFSLKGYKTKTIKATYPVGTTTLNETLNKK